MDSPGHSDGYSTESSGTSSGNTSESSPSPKKEERQAEVKPLSGEAQRLLKGEWSFYASAYF